MALTALLEPTTKGQSLVRLHLTPPTPLTEVVQALVVDGTTTGIHSLHGHLLELPELERGKALLIRPHPLPVPKPGRERVSAGSHNLSTS